MSEVFGEQILKGLGAAGWMIGFVAGIGALLIVIGVFGLLLIEAAKFIWPDEMKQEENEQTDVGP